MHNGAWQLDKRRFLFIAMMKTDTGVGQWFPLNDESRRDISAGKHAALSMINHYGRV